MNPIAIRVHHHLYDQEGNYRGELSQQESTRFRFGQ